MLKSKSNLHYYVCENRKNSQFLYLCQNYLAFGAIRKNKEYTCMLYSFFVYVESLLHFLKKVSKKYTFCNGFYFWSFTGKPYVATIAPLLEACSVLTNILKPILGSLVCTPSGEKRKSMRACEDTTSGPVPARAAKDAVPSCRNSGLRHAVCTASLRPSSIISPFRVVHITLRSAS
jgi:hypothetical protein